MMQVYQPEVPKSAKRQWWKTIPSRFMKSNPEQEAKWAWILLLYNLALKIDLGPYFIKSPILLIYTVNNLCSFSLIPILQKQQQITWRTESLIMFRLPCPLYQKRPPSLSPMPQSILPVCGAFLSYSNLHQIARLQSRHHYYLHLMILRATHLTKQIVGMRLKWYQRHPHIILSQVWIWTNCTGMWLFHTPHHECLCFGNSLDLRLMIKLRKILSMAWRTLLSLRTTATLSPLPPLALSWTHGTRVWKYRRRYS